MASILEIITGIQEAIKEKHHGGTPVGLKRETEDLIQGCSIYDPRVMDGFGVQYQGNMLILKYHSEMPLIKVHDKAFETDIQRTVKDVVEHIKKEYKKVTRKSLDLTSVGEIQILVQSANRRTAYVNAVQNYVINGADGFGKQKALTEPEQQTNFADIAKRWLMGVRQPKSYLK